MSQCLKGHTSSIISVGLNERVNIIVSVCAQGKVLIWDSDKGVLVDSIEDDQSKRLLTSGGAEYFDRKDLLNGCKLPGFSKSDECSIVSGEDHIPFTFDGPVSLLKIKYVQRKKNYIVVGATEDHDVFFLQVQNRAEWN